jgi:hypothetical protein
MVFGTDRVVLTMSVDFRNKLSHLSSVHANKYCNNFEKVQSKVIYFSINASEYY